MATSGVRVKWLGGVPGTEAGVTFGVPWRRGSLKRDEAVALVDADGKRVPVQTWHTAYWPDGSVKWTAHAGVFSSDSPAGYRVLKGEPEAPGAPVKVREGGDAIEIETGKLACRIPRKGAVILEELRTGERVVAKEGKLLEVL